MIKLRQLLFLLFLILAGTSYLGIPPQERLVSWLPFDRTDILWLFSCFGIAYIYEYFKLKEELGIK